MAEEISQGNGHVTTRPLIRPYEARPAPATGLSTCRLAERSKSAFTRLEQGIERVPTGLGELDKVMSGGFPVPSLVMLAAKPKCGKSTILLSMCLHVVSRGGFAYLIDRENGLDRLLRRILCSRAYVDPALLGKEDYSLPDSWVSAKDLVSPGGPFGERLFVEHERKFDWKFLDKRLEDLRHLSEENEESPFLVVLDSLQKMPMLLHDRRNEIDQWMRALEYLRDKHRAVIVVASELKRPPQGQEYKPNEVSLKESGDIEYTADVVLTLDRPGSKEDEFVTERPPQPTVLRILYNRDGPTGRVADYRLVYPYHQVQEIAQASYAGIREAHLNERFP